METREVLTIPPWIHTGGDGAFQRLVMEVTGRVLATARAKARIENALRFDHHRDERRPAISQRVQDMLAFGSTSPVDPWLVNRR